MEGNGNNMIRVITGSAKNRKLFAPQSGTKPLTDRIKVSIFDLIRDFIPEAKVLDLYAGSGAFGIEALSRGAAIAIFVDMSSESCEVINRNLQLTNLGSKAEVKQSGVNQFLASNSELFDIIFLDPPFPDDISYKLSGLIKSIGALKDDGVIILRIPAAEVSPETLEEKGITIRKVYEKEYGISRVIFYRIVK